MTQKTSRKEYAGLLSGLIIASVLIFYPVIEANLHPAIGSNVERMNLKGDVKVYVDGVLVAENHNTIRVQFYDVIACRVFNETTNGCSGGGYSNGTQNRFLKVIGLSTDSATPSSSGSGCAGYISSSNLDAAIATLSHAQNTNSISLTASWVANASVTSIQKACLFYVSGSTINAGVSQSTYAQTTFTPVNINNGQSIAVTWTFTF